MTLHKETTAAVAISSLKGTIWLNGGNHTKINYFSLNNWLTLAERDLLVRSRKKGESPDHYDFVSHADSDKP